MRKIILFLSALFFFLATQAQDTLLPVKHFDQFNGLEARVLYDIIKDRDGFIWLGTENGVFRFDGRYFHHYTTRDGLCDSEILRIFDDSKGNIWCGGYNGKISLIENGVVNQEADFIKNWQSEGMIRDFIEDTEGNIYAAGEQTQIFKIDLQRRVTNLPLNHSFVQPRKLLVYKNQLIVNDHHRNFIYTGTDFEQYNGKYAWLFISEEYPAAWGIRSPGVFVNDLDTSMWFDVSKYAPDFASFSVNQLNRNLVLVSFGQKDALLYNLEKKNYQVMDLPDEALIVDVTMDDQDNIWVITPRNGLYAFKYERGENAMDDPFIYKGNILNAYMDENVIIAVEYGADVITKNRETGTIKSFPFQFNDAGLRQTVDYATFVRWEDTIFISTGIGLYGYSNEQLSFYHKNPGKDFFIYGNSNFYFRWAHAIYAVDRTFSYQDRFFNGRAYAMCRQEDKVWISYQEGLTYYDIITRELKKTIYRVPGNGRVEDIKTMPGNGLVFCTSNKGIVRMVDEKVVQQIQVEDGLLDNDCKEMDACKTGWIIRHPMGLSLVDTINQIIRTVSKWRDIPMSTVNNMTVFGDTILLSCRNGLVKTSIKALFQQFPDVRMVKFTRIMSDDHLWRPGDIVLKYHDNRLKIDYALAEYNQPNMVQYFWRINQEKWTLTNANTLELPDLQPGKYVLQIKAKAPGFEETAITELQFWVKPPFWKSPYLWLLIILVFVLALWGMLRYKYRKKLVQEREKAYIQHQLMSYEQKALNAMMNPHFIFNAMGSIQYLLNHGDNEQANDYLVKFSRLIRKSLETAQTEFCVLDDEIERLTLYLQLEKMRLDGQMKFEITVDETLDPEKINIPTMILQTYIENAVIHGVALAGEKGQVNISFMADADRVVVTIEDNGPGFNAQNHSKRSQRFGLNATEKRLELLTQITGKSHHVYIISPVNSNGGTRIILRFPLIYV